MPTSTPPPKKNDAASLTHAAVGGKPSPRLPHERDESSDAGAEARPIMEKAGEDVAAGRTNTDRSETTNEVYGKLRGG